MAGIRDYMLNKKDYLMTAVGNPDGDDKPNKKYFDVSRVPYDRPQDKADVSKLAPCLGS